MSNMSHIASLIVEAAEAGVTLFCRDGQLGFELRGDDFPEALKQQVVANKADIIEYLTQLEARQAETGPVRSEIVAVPRGNDPLPLSFAQQRLWFIDRMEEGSSQYNMPGAMAVTGQFDIQCAEQAFAKVIERHDTLRTVFTTQNGDGVQVIREQVEFKLDYRDLQALPEQEREQTIEALLADEAERPFDLNCDVMLRAGYWQTSDDTGILSFNMHHIASDGWSMGILVDEFLSHYKAILAGQSAELPELAIQYADYALWQRDWLSGDVLEQQLSYWRTTLDDLPQLHELPIDFPRPLEADFIGDRVRTEVDGEVLAGLQKLANEHQCTLFMVLHAAFAVLLSRYSNQTDIVIGTPVANRLQQELEPLVGFFVNTLVLRTQCEPNQSLGQFIEQVKQVNLDAQNHQDVPFELLVEQLQPQRSTAHSPLFQVMFTMDETEMDEVKLDDVTFTPCVSDRVQAQFDLLLNAVPVGDSLQLDFEFATALFGHDTITRMAGHFAELLKGMVARPDATLAQLPLVGTIEHRQLTVEFNGEDVGYDAVNGIHQLFEVQAGQNTRCCCHRF